jgi:NitT/TauT family transport system substrate-binding protein
MLSRRQMLAMAAATATVAPIVTACSRSQPAKSTTKTLDKVTYLTGYGTTPREEYAQIAKAEGNFKAAGLDVTIAPGQPSNANITSILGGKAQFASIDFVSAARGFAAVKGAFCVIAAIQNRTLLSMISLEGMGVTEPSDLMGKTVATGAQAATQTLYPTYARLAGVDGSKTKITNADTSTLPSLLSQGKVAAIGGYSIDVPTIRKASGGREPIVLPYAKYIGDLYGTVVITTNELAKSKPDLVRKFAQAIMEGCQYGVAHPDVAGKDIHSAIAADAAADVAETMTLMKPYVDTGIMDEGRVAAGISLLEGAGLVPQNSLTASQLVRFDLGPQKA